MQDLELIDYMREQLKVLRAEMDLLNKTVARLEDSRDTWKALCEAWQWVAENKA
jgi:prefoldin subunit 5